MPGIYSWVAGTVTSVRSTVSYVVGAVAASPSVKYVKDALLAIPGVKDAKDTLVALPSVAMNIATKVKDAAISIYQSEAVRKELSARFKVFLQGLKYPFQASTIKRFLNSQRTRDIYLFESIYQNTVKTILPVGIYIYFLRNAIRKYIPGMKESYPEMVLDLLASLYFINKSAADMYVNNTMYTATLSKTVTDDVAAEKVDKDKNKHKDKSDNSDADNAAEAPEFDACEHGVDKRFIANLASNGYYLGNIFGVKVVEKMVPFGEYLSVPLRAHITGLGLLEYKYAQKCTEHRYEMLSKNNTYAFGVGAAMVGGWIAAKYLLKYFTGIESYFIDDALYNMIYQYFAVSVSLHDKPIPQDDQSIDVTYLNRLALQAFFRQAAKPAIASFIRGAQCDIVVMSVAPQKETLDTLKLLSDAAYIRVKNQLYYVNKKTKECLLLNMDDSKSFDLALKIVDMPLDTPKKLSEDELDRINLQTGHYHDINKKYLRYVTDSELVKLAKKKFIDGDWHSNDEFFSLDALKKRRAMMLYRKAYEDTVMSAVVGIKSQREKYKLLASFTTYVPFVIPQDSRRQLSMLFDPKLKMIINKVRRFYQTKDPVVSDLLKGWVKNGEVDLDLSVDDYDDVVVVAPAAKAKADVVLPAKQIAENKVPAPAPAPAPAVQAVKGDALQLEKKSSALKLIQPDPDAEAEGLSSLGGVRKTNSKPDVLPGADKPALPVVGEPRNEGLMKSKSGSQLGSQLGRRAEEDEDYALFEQLTRREEAASHSQLGGESQPKLDLKRDSKAKDETDGDHELSDWNVMKQPAQKAVVPGVSFFAQQPAVKAVSELDALPANAVSQPGAAAVRVGIGMSAEPATK